MKQKIILKKNKQKALFLYRRVWSDNSLEIEFVVATLQDSDINKGIGETVDEWYWGHYFDKDLKTALIYLSNN